MEKLKKNHDIGVCCSKCAIAVPDRPIGEYYLLRVEITDDRFWVSSHGRCKRDWIVAKDRESDVWYRIRSPQSKPGPSGLYAMCEYGIDECEYYVEKVECENGDSCIFAHSERECRVWSEMHASNLEFEDLKAAVLEEIYATQLARGQTEVMAADHTPPESTPACPSRAQSSDRPQSSQSGAGDVVFTETTADVTQTGAVNAVAISAATPSAIALEPVIPLDAVRPGAKYKDHMPLLSAADKISLKIRVTRVDSPHHLYFQIWDDVSRMENCWRGMNVFYNGEAGEKYKMMGEDLYRNLPVALRMKSKSRNLFYWRRGEIIDYINMKDGVIEVRDVDFGGLYYTTLDGVRFLSGQFFQFEKQAVEARLAYVSPRLSDKWSKEAIEFTRTFLNKSPLMAEVMGMIESLPAIQVSDTVPGSDTKIYLSRLLMDNGFASKFCRTCPKPFSAGDAAVEAQR